MDGGNAGGSATNLCVPFPDSERAEKLLGGVAEWPMAAVLKTVTPQGVVGSNPTPSASLVLDPILGGIRMCLLWRAVQNGIGSSRGLANLALLTPLDGVNGSNLHDLDVFLMVLRSDVRGHPAPSLIAR